MESHLPKNAPDYPLRLLARISNVESLARMFGERQALRLPTVDYSYRDFAYDQSPVIHVLRQMPDIASTSAKTFAEYVVASVSSLFMPSPTVGTPGLAFAVAHLVVADHEHGS